MTRSAPEARKEHQTDQRRVRAIGRFACLLPGLSKAHVGELANRLHKEQFGGRRRPVHGDFHRADAVGLVLYLLTHHFPTDYVRALIDELAKDVPCPPSGVCVGMADLERKGTSEPHRRERRRLMEVFLANCPERAVGHVRVDHVATYAKLLTCQRAIDTGRAFYYRARLLTLMRGSELGRIVRGDLRQEGDITYLQVRPEVAKTGQPRLVPLAEAIATDLAAHALRLRGSDALFPNQIQRLTWQRDLELADLNRCNADGKLVMRSMRLTGSIWLREVGCPLQDEMLLSGGTGRGAEKTRVWHYHNAKRELPRLARHVERLAVYAQGGSARPHADAAGES